MQDDSPSMLIPIFHLIIDLFEFWFSEFLNIFKDNFFKFLNVFELLKKCFLIVNYLADIFFENVDVINSKFKING